MERSISKWLMASAILLSSQTGFAEGLSCRHVFREGKVDVALKVDPLSESLHTELLAAMQSDPTLTSFLENPNFIKLVKAISENKSLEEMRPLLFEVWKDAELSEQNLNKLTGIKVLAKENTSPLIEAIKKIEIDKQVAQSKLGRMKEKIGDVSARLITQIRGMRMSMAKSKQMIQTEMHPAVLDANIFDTVGYLRYGLEASRLRKWESPQGSFGAIRPTDIKNMDPVTFIKVLMLASQIEAPIGEYSDASGHIFHLFPQASRFMGKTEEQAAHHRDSGAKLTCTNSWCFEENRHEGLLENLARTILGFLPPNSRPFSADKTLSPFKPADVEFHVMARANNELAASSTYYILGSHAEGNLAVYLKNIRGDEVKHSTIFTGLYKYLKGDTYWTRLKGVIKKTLIEIVDKNENSEYASVLTREPLTLIEGLYAQVTYEKQIKKYMDSLPLKTLRKIFETEITLKELEAYPMSPEKQAQVAKLSAIEKARRESFANWPKKQREKAYALEYFEANNNSAISKIITQDLKTFEGAQDYGSEAHQLVLQKISLLTAEGVAADFGRPLKNSELVLLKESLTQTLRDYQIFNNWRSREQGLKVEFIDAITGFDIVRDEAFEQAGKVKQ